MLAVAIDTSTDMLACAVGRMNGPDGGAACHAAVELLASGDHLCRRHANVELVTTLDRALDDAQLSMHDVDVVLVGRGPGSFTGVRIGISTAKGLARGANLPLYGVSTLDAAAWTAWRVGVRGLLGVAADAMRGEVYPALYSLDDEGASRLFDRERVVKAADAVEEWRKLPNADDLQLTGDGLVRHGRLFEAAGLMDKALDRALWWPSGEGLLLAWAASRATDGADAASGDPASVLPIYTRLSDAEENERKRLGLAQSPSSAVTGVADELAGRHLQFRPMGPADAEAASALEARCFDGMGHNAWSPAQFLSEFGQDAAVPRSWWVAHDDGELVGIAGGMMVEHDLQVLDVAVAPERRREGIARKLLSHVSYDAQMLGCTTASLEVEASNDGAQALYDSLGFSQAGVRRGYYGAGNDALVMTAKLPLVLPVDAASPEPTAASVRPWPLPSVRRTDDERARLASLNLVMAIESSCDETAVAIIDGEGRLLANQVSTQIDFHARFGGVVPEIASRKHVEVIVGVVDAALEEATEALGLDGGTLEPSELAAVGVTQGPGLVGALVVGVAFAKGFAYAADIPLIAVNHLEGHLYANLLTTPDLKPPFIFTLVSGGHTMLVHVKAWGDYEVMGETLDDAVGEAFDKVAKALGLGYPGGPIISRLAETGDPHAIEFPRALNRKGDYRFSLSGLKTAVVTYIEQETAAGRTIHLPDLAASFEAAVFDVQYKKARNALRETGAREYCIGGGVAANPHLRQMMIKKLGRQGIRVTVPPQNACTDNAAMIAEVARRKFAESDFAPLDIDADPNMTL
ncbi:multifunctional tRNA N6-adenosine(37)-N6- threonylcarbamoyltransferase complex dimerization subunit type 1 TsaB/ribosomal protein alanine acetyltransferase/tRNA (adenosine(37)-N6)-threonylcarbamoyltransferase complex transferase subunit TsaD [Collinsella sp. An2]|nr:multifunctional tRNA N6-adenosine(37)-N6- threonylcarbamoyltransferase complex dimerization subunit type 1 TsaB/ribosomal protein alanine acetyltransferase/tRNA (adenosine(37)-N6)-threonylcarbamoyltransferase complex transferase subunit TsaD [Collinsella sp. An2]